MIGILIQFIVLLAVVGILYMIGKLIIQGLQLPAPAMVILQVICLLVFLIWLVSVFGAYGGVAMPWRPVPLR